MTATQVSLSAINDAIREVCLALEERHDGPPSWTSMSEDDLWRELVACILGSRVKFEVAHSAVERMNLQQLFSEERRSSSFSQYEQDVLGALSNGGATGELSCYPLSRVRGKQIRRAAERLYGSRNSVRSFLEDSENTRDARRRLALEVSGLGPKQASLFLRNIGYATHVAVLDAHVLTYMSWVGLTERPMRAIPSLRRYEALEDAFIDHAYSCGYTPDRFDLAIWVVVKVAKQERKTWG